MEPFVVLVAIAVLIGLDLAALRWGFDSRRPRRPRGDRVRDWW